VSFFDLKALLAPFVDEARAADRRRRIEYLHLLELKRRSIAKNRINRGDSIEAADEHAEAELKFALDRAVQIAQREERSRG
jgi:hypothetical protein